MSENDKISSSAPKLNAGASEFVPGSFASKPTNAPKPSTTPKGGNMNRTGGYQGRNQNNRNMSYGNQHGGMQQPFYQQPNAPYDYMMDPNAMFHMQMHAMAAQQGLAYDPTTGYMFNPVDGTVYMLQQGYMMPGAVPGMIMDPAVYAATMGMVPVAPVVPGAVPAGADENTTATDATSEVPSSADQAELPGQPATSAAPQEGAAVPAAPSTAKYVPPSAAAAASAPAAEATAAKAVSKAADQLAGLTIDAEQDVLVDIECPTPGAITRYSKNAILALYSAQGTVIPPELKEYYKPAEYAAGSVDGSAFVRAPLGSLSSISDSSFGGGGRGGKGSQGNLRHSQSGPNLERNVSTSSFGGGGGGRRKGNHRDNDKDREPGELVEGDEGFVPYEGGDEPTPRERSSRRQRGGAPAVYKSKFALDANDPQAIVRKANLILNKLSVTNFDKLKDEFLTLLQTEATTDESLQRAVEALVAKAQMEENFCFVYADLCRYLIDTWTALEPEDGTFASAAQDEEGAAAAPASAEGAAAGEGEAPAKKEKVARTMGKVFKDGLVSRCQTEFEFDHISALKEIRENAELSPDERTEKEILLKKRTTGHMRFIGELYMQELISASVMKNQCLERLLNSTVEEELVCLCKLFQTIGAKIEKYHLDKAKQKKYKSQNMQDVLPGYFVRIDQIAANHPSSRVRFMMRDLSDMRKNNWQARREEEKMVNLDKKNDDFAPVQGTYVSGDARNADFGAPVDEWSVVGAAGKKRGGPSSGAPSPVPGGMSRSGSSAQISRSNSTSTTNLNAMDRRGPRGPSGGPVAPLKKEKSGGNAGRGAGKDGRLPRANSGSARGGDSPVPDAADDAPAAAEEQVQYNTDLAAIQKRVRSAMKELYGTGIQEEATLTFQELKPAPTLMADIVKDMVSQAVETSSEKSCVALCELLGTLRTTTVTGLPAPLLSADDVKEAVYRFLANFDDVLIDAPKAGTLGAVIVANLCDKGLLALDLFATLPEDNDFAFSSKFVEFVVQVLAALNTVCGAERAESLYRAAGLNLLASVNAPPKETPESVLGALGTKYGVAYLS